MREWLWRVWAMVRRGRLVAEKREELQHHLDMEIESGLRQGLSADEARRRARWRAGLVSDGLEDTHAALGIPWLDGAALDLRHAWRALTRTRGFGVVAVLVLAASVAINTLIFFMLDGVVLRPLPYASPDRLVRLYDSSPARAKFPMAIGHFLDLDTSEASIESIALYAGRDMELTAGAGRSRPLTGVSITSDYFTVLGRPPILGRAFTNADLRKDVRHVILSERLWQEHFQGDPAIVGTMVRLDREPWTVIGVAPPGFQHIGGDYRSPPQGESVDVWLPFRLDLEEEAIRYYHFSNAIARLRADVSPAQARDDLARFSTAYQQRHRKAGAWQVRMEPLLDEVTGRSRQVVWLLVGAGGLVLLVACANIAGLCVARAVSRRKELALRRALGANRWQLVRVGLAENLLIGVAGAALGLLLAGIGLPLLRQLLPADIPRAHEIALTPTAALFAAGIALATVLIAGLLPSGESRVLDASTRVTGGRDARTRRTALVAGQIALAGLLCAGALFLLRSYQELGARDHGFKPAGVLTFQLAVPRAGSPNRGDLGRLIETIRQRIEDVPGVASAGASTNLPWSGYDENTNFIIAGRTSTDRDTPGARYQAATPGYFEATGMRLVSGRLFERARDGQGQPLSLIVNDALARRNFPRGDAVGSVVRIFGAPRQIVGVIGDIKDTPADLETPAAFWVPLEQQEFNPIFFAVRVRTGDPASLTAAVTAAVQSVDPELPLADVRTLERRALTALAPRRFALWLFQAFAALALLLSGAGIYGLLAYIVRQRRKELSVRAALGASRAELGRMVLADGVKMAAIGAAGCLLLIPVGGSLLRTFLFNVHAFDLITIAGAPAALLIVSLLASLGPARSATRSNPATALRDD